MVLSRLFRPRPQHAAAGLLYAAAVTAARRPDFYTRLGVADSREGRFELYGLHVYLLMDRLKGEGEAARETSQYLVEALVTGLDDAFHELGVGHVAVPKRVKTLAAAFMGRVQAYDQALALPDDIALRALIGRTVYGADGSQAEALAAYVRVARDDLASQPLSRLLTGQADWVAI
ncbi:MAG: ubiquinol-cytochrome reductase [Caulobacteraceae bacterium]|nr:ubiquinol-cytochrome reductase [Caulobacteraceae bacterium]